MRSNLPGASLYFKSTGEKPFCLIAEPEGEEVMIAPGERVLMKLSGESPQVEPEVIIRGNKDGDTSISVWPDSGNYELWREAGGKSTRIRNA